MSPITTDPIPLEDPTEREPVLEGAVLAEVSPEWVQEEFERIIAAEWPQPRRRRWTPPVTARPRPNPRGHGRTHSDYRGDRPTLNTGSAAGQAPPRQRSPPPEPIHRSER
jgi:hypothetical protein